MIFGVGTNDANYVVKWREEGVFKTCPYYAKWIDMLARCYFHKHPTYNGCAVCNSWLLFSSFRQWMEQQDWKGKHLDKDLLGQDSKLYSPTTCAFITPETNNIVASLTNTTGYYKRGNGRFRTSTKRIGKSTFDTKEEASYVWRQEKAKTLLAFAKTEFDTRASIMLTYTAQRLAFSQAKPLPGGV